ncbi:MAG TPA: hypothetical protein VJ836_00940 [Candidatus Saccharimonadales bacterium]|nr:hypothetical protein [Candidatus Saccharimonadales bacterium]
MAYHLLAIDHQAHEERLVQRHAHRVVTGLDVHARRITQEVQGMPKDVPSDRKLFLSRVQAARDVLAFLTNGRDLLAQCFLGPALLSRQIKQIALFVVEHLQPFAVLLA